MPENTSVKVRSGAESRPATSTAAEEPYVAPLADIYETPEAYVLLLDMPGAARQGVSVRLENNTLYVKAPVEALHGADAAMLHREHMAGGYERAFALGEDINPDNIDAQFENGVLTIKLFKSEEVRPREIKIR